MLESKDLHGSFWFPKAAILFHVKAFMNILKVVSTFCRNKQKKVKWQKKLKSQISAFFTQKNTQVKLQSDCQLGYNQMKTLLGRKPGSFSDFCSQKKAANSQL